MPKLSEITLTLRGTRARHGVSLSDFETFIQNFVSALRDFDRDRQGVPTRKSGHPEARATAVTAFRLISFREGKSGVATIEPEALSEDENTERLAETEPLQIANLKALLTRIDHEESLPSPVADALGKAVKSVGDDGALEIQIPTDGEPIAVTVDAARLARIRAAPGPEMVDLVTFVSGRLHEVDFEPGRLAIRASDGVDWVCSYPKQLEHRVEGLVNRLVGARGAGERQSARKGKMDLSAIEEIETVDQTSLFSGEFVPVEALEIDQRISEPQGLDVMAVPEWTEADDAYLAALTGD
jgi:hypothetical protein